MSASREEHWEHGGLATGLAVGLGAMWVWAITTPATQSRVAAELSDSGPAPDIGLILMPLGLLLGGLALGGLLWTFLVERRLPTLALRHGYGRSRSWPMLAASVAALVVGRIAAEALTIWSSRLVGDASEFVVRTSPISAAMGLSAVVLTWALVYMVGRFIMGDDDEDPAEAVSSGRAGGAGFTASQPPAP